MMGLAMQDAPGYDLETSCKASPDHFESSTSHPADSELHSHRCVADISTSGGMSTASGSGPTPHLSALSTTWQSRGDLSEDWDASGDELIVGSAAHACGTNGDVQGGNRGRRSELGKWPPPSRRLSTGVNLSPCVPPGALPEWHPVEAETPSDDDRLWATSSSSANSSPNPKPRILSSSSASEACSGRRSHASHNFGVAIPSSALVPAGNLVDSFGSSAIESIDSIDHPSGTYRRSIFAKQDHPSKHRHRRFPGRRRGKEPTLHIMESCSEAAEASEDTGVHLGSSFRRGATQDGAAQLAGAAAAAIAASAEEAHCSSTSHQGRLMDADQSVGDRLVSMFAPLFGLRFVPEADRSADAMGARLAAYWCEAEVLCPTDDENGWEKHGRKSGK